MSKKKTKRSAEARSLELEEESKMAVAGIGESKTEEIVNNENIVETIANDNQTVAVVEVKNDEENSEVKAVETVANEKLEIEEPVVIVNEEINEVETVEVKVETVEKVNVVETEQVINVVNEEKTVVEVEESKQTDVKVEEVVESVTLESVAEKKEALDNAKQKFKEAVARSLDEELAKVENLEVISSQFNKSSDFVQNMLKRLEEHLEIAGVKGRNRVETVVDGVLGDNVINDFATKTLGYVGEKMAQGYTLGIAPAVTVTGAVRGVYRKIVE